MNAAATRFDRQQTLVPRERLAARSLSVLGVGAIGRQVAVQLAALGAIRLQLVDFDQVEATNITTQGYLHADIGLPKVLAAASACRQIEPQMVVETIEDRFRPQQRLGDAIFCCVDSISARSAIWRACGQHAPFWCDGRMLGEVIRILTAADAPGRAHYASTLFEPSDAQVGSCTAHGIIYTAALAAGLMLHQFCRWLRGQALDSELTWNLLASELVAN